MDKQQLSELRICIELWLNTKKIDSKYVWLTKDDDYGYFEEIMYQV